MKIFISSVEAGYQDYRAVVQEAVETLGHEVIRAADLPTSAQTPQQGCLAGVRRSDVVILLSGQECGRLSSRGRPRPTRSTGRPERSSPCLSSSSQGSNVGHGSRRFSTRWRLGHRTISDVIRRSWAVEGARSNGRCTSMSLRCLPARRRADRPGRRSRIHAVAHEGRARRQPQGARDGARRRRTTCEEDAPPRMDDPMVYSTP